MTDEVAMTRRPELDVMALTVMLALATVALVATTPDLSQSMRPGRWWVFAVVLALFGLFEYVVFHVQFRREAITFSLSEIPTAFAFVFLAPVPALAARIPISILVLAIARRMSPLKLAFNGALFSFELALAIQLFRAFTRLWGSDDGAEVAAVVASLIVVTPVNSMLVSVAISRYEPGGPLLRIVQELRATWWMYTVNSVLAAMTIALTLIQPWLALLAALPAAGIWYVLQSFGDQGQRLRDLDEIHGFAGRVGLSLQLDEIGEVAVTETMRLLRADGAALVRFDDDPAIVRRSGSIMFRLPERPDDPGWCDLIEQGRTQLLTAAELAAAGVVMLGHSAGVIVAPVHDEAGPIALLVMVERDAPPYRFRPNDVARAQSLTEQLATSLRKGVLHQRIEYEARHDALTGLPARSVFETAIATTLASSDRNDWFVMMLDLDRFKEVNDTLGHHAGDELLVVFSRRLAALLCPGETLARLAGDEFAIFGRRSGPDEIADLAQACVREGARPVTLDGLEIVVTVSVGVAELIQSDRDAVQPMRRADIAMYNAKWQRSGLEFYRDEIDRRTPARLSMLGDLQMAIETDELHVVYQPKLDLVTGRVIAAEALVRWDHGTRGHVPPTEFVRVAEDTGLIKQLTDLVLAAGIKALRGFNDRGLDLGLAVNLSTHDLLDGRLPDRVNEYLTANGVDPSKLTLEITESSLLVDVPRTRATINDLHDIGVCLAVDDFGTGYSSLSYLRRLPVSELKIDQSFVAGLLTDEQDEVIVRSTVDLGHNLGLRVVAEGVESAAVMDRLREFGCDVAQGYCISRPITATELVAWLPRVEAARVAAEPTAWVHSFI